MLEIEIGELWTVAAVLAGFQVNALVWRISRELQMESQSERVWLTLADGMIMVSLLLLAFGVFAAPMMGAASLDLAIRLCGLSLTIFVSMAFVFAGHYNLYSDRLWVDYVAPGKKAPRGQVTRQEVLGLAIALLTIGAYGIWWYLAS